MAAHSLSVPADCSSGGLPFSRYASTSPLSSSTASRQASGKPPARQRLDRFSRTYLSDSSDGSDLDLIFSSLIESLQQGVIVVSRALKPVYWNVRAKRLCRALVDSEFLVSELPVAVSEVCHRLLKANRSASYPVVMECQLSQAQTLRISARWLQLTAISGSSAFEGRPGPSATPVSAEPSNRTQPSNEPAYILVFLENCSEVLREELRIEQRKYDLTEREAEVWMLLRQEYTYQEIAKMLQISLNTVKTHVKNVYAKKRSCQGREKFWCSE